MSTDASGRTSADDVPGVDRLLTLSDGVVAIAITLLVLQLAVPSLRPADANSASALASSLAQESDRYISYLISFYVIAQFWLIHHRVFGRIGGQREGLAWWNFAFLFTITVMPFTSSLLGRYAQNPLAVDIFAANLLLASLATQATTAYGRRRGLVTHRPDPRSLRMTRAESAGAVLIICVSAAVAWTSTSLAKYCWLLLAAVPWVVDHLLYRRDRPAGP